MFLGGVPIPVQRALFYVVANHMPSKKSETVAVIICEFNQKANLCYWNLCRLKNLDQSQPIL